MKFEEVVHIIPEVSFKELPGEPAHNRIMNKEVRQKIFQNYGHQHPYKDSAVIALLYPGPQQQAQMLFILRKSYDGHHSGQIAFPGGKKEPEDLSLRETALRETFEEVGVKPNEIEIVKKLSEVFIPVSNYLVQPYLAVAQQTPLFIKDPVEVEEILEFDLGKILNNPLVKLQKNYFNQPYEIYAFQIDSYQIWGATAMILAEVRSLLGYSL